MQTKNNDLIIENSVLAWARKSLGFSIDEVVEKTKIDKSIIESWEKEPAAIPIPHLKKLSKLYKRPLTVFFLKQPPEGIVPPDFRTLDSVKTEEISKEARLAIRRAQRNRVFYTELVGNKVKGRKDIALTDEIIDLVSYFRKAVGIDTKEQSEWENENQALNTWIDAVENIGIPIFQMSLPIEEFRGFCLRGNDLVPAIVLNQKDFPKGRIFTLFHELYHVFIKQEEINKLEATKGIKKAHKIIELKANDFAASFLVPKDVFLNMYEVQDFTKTKDVQNVSKLKKYFHVSEDVIYRRFATFNIITQKEYEEKHAELLKLYAKMRAQQKMKTQNSEKPFIPNFHREVAYKTGFDLGRKAFTALGEGRVSTYDLVNFFGVKTGNLQKVKKNIDLHYKQRPNKNK